MVKAAILLIGVIPVIFAIMIAVPLVTKPEIPTSALVPEDQISIEYTKHQLKVVSFGVTERAGSQYTEILTIKNNGEIRYNVIDGGFPQPEKKSRIDEDQLRKLTAMIKETGFMEIPTDQFPIDENVKEYQKSTIKITLNEKTHQIHWPDQNATSIRIAPIITQLELELNQIIDQIL